MEATEALKKLIKPLQHPEETPESLKALKPEYHSQVQGAS